MNSKKILIFSHEFPPFLGANRKRTPINILDKYGVDLTLVEANTKEELIELLSGSSVVISARMHALILALTCNCKIFTYPISSKLIEFGKMFNKDFDKKCLLKVQNNINSRIVEVLND